MYAFRNNLATALEEAPAQHEKARISRNRGGSAAGNSRDLDGPRPYQAGVPLEDPFWKSCSATAHGCPDHSTVVVLPVDGLRLAEQAASQRRLEVEGAGRHVRCLSGVQE
jgi:hypothetical protein